jgi:hypothetical protein
MARIDTSGQSGFLIFASRILLASASLDPEAGIHKADWEHIYD